MRVGTSIRYKAIGDFIKDHPHACGDKVYRVNSHISR